MIQKTLAGGIFKDTIRVPHALYKSTVEYYSAELKLDCNLVGSYSPSNDINTSYGDIDILVKCDDDFDLGKKKDSVKSILNVDINLGFELEELHNIKITNPYKHIKHGYKNNC